MAGFHDEEVIERKKKKADETRSVVYELKGVLPGEVAVALRQVLDARGLTFTEVETVRSTPFGVHAEPFQRYSVQFAGQEVIVPWGAYAVEGYGRMTLQLGGREAPPHANLVCQPPGKDTPDYKALADAVLDKAREVQLFRGRALKIESPHDLIVPNALDLQQVPQPLFDADIAETLEITLFAPIVDRMRFRERGIRLRRGVILEGPYGVGKSLAAYVSARLAVEHGWTFMLSNNNMAEVAVQIGRAIQPTVLFIEDIDGAASGDRDALASLLNLISGVEAKKASEMIIILSTNFVERIDPGFLRPERIDSIVTVRPPSRDTIGRLLQQQLGEHLSEHAQWPDLLDEAEGATPAVLGEAMERAKIHQLRFADDARVDVPILRRMLGQMDRQRKLATPVFVKATVAEQLADSLHKVTCDGI